MCVHVMSAIYTKNNMDEKYAHTDARSQSARSLMRFAHEHCSRSARRSALTTLGARAYSSSSSTSRMKRPGRRVASKSAMTMTG